MNETAIGMSAGQVGCGCRRVVRNWIKKNMTRPLRDVTREKPGRRSMKKNKHTFCGHLYRGCRIGKTRLSSMLEACLVSREQ